MLEKINRKHQVDEKLENFNGRFNSIKKESNRHSRHEK